MPPDPNHSGALGERIARIEASLERVVSWMESHGPSAMTHRKEIWDVIDALRADVAALRSDLMMAKGALRGTGAVATATTTWATGWGAASRNTGT